MSSAKSHEIWNHQKPKLNLPVPRLRFSKKVHWPQDGKVFLLCVLMDWWNQTFDHEAPRKIKWIAMFMCSLVHNTTFCKGKSGKPLQGENVSAESNGNSRWVVEMLSCSNNGAYCLQAGSFLELLNFRTKSNFVNFCMLDVNIIKWHTGLIFKLCETLQTVWRPQNTKTIAMAFRSYLCEKCQTAMWH